MFAKLKALLALFKTGSAVANPGLWKAGQITGTLVGALILALVNFGALFGITIPIDPVAANAIGGGVVAVVSIVLTLVTSKSIGVNGVQPANEPIPAAMPSPQPAPTSTTTANAAPSGPNSGPSLSRFDSSTRQRAAEYLRQRAGNPSDREFQAP